MSRWMVASGTPPRRPYGAGVFAAKGRPAHKPDPLGPSSPICGQSTGVLDSEPGPDDWECKRCRGFEL